MNTQLREIKFVGRVLSKKKKLSFINYTFIKFQFRYM